MDTGGTALVVWKFGVYGCRPKAVYIRKKMVFALTLVAGRPRPALLATALAVDTDAVAVAVADLAVARRDVALGPLPAALAVAHAPAVLAVARAQNRTHT